jgi:hypothetical protein
VSCGYFFELLQALLPQPSHGCVWIRDWKVAATPVVQLVWAPKVAGAGVRAFRPAFIRAGCQAARIRGVPRVTPQLLAKAEALLRSEGETSAKKDDLRTRTSRAVSASRHRCEMAARRRALRAVGIE